MRGPRKPYSKRPGAGAFHRCVVPVAQTRHGEPPLTCGGLIFGRDLVQHLIECHDIPAGPMSPAELELAYQTIAQVAETEHRVAHSAVCECGANMRYGSAQCQKCFRARQSAGALVPKGTPNAEALRMYRARAKERGKCSICRARYAEPDHSCCHACLESNQERNRLARSTEES